MAQQWQQPVQPWQEINPSQMVSQYTKSSPRQTGKRKALLK